MAFIEPASQQCASNAVLGVGIAALNDAYALPYATPPEILAKVAPPAVSWALSVMTTSCQHSTLCPGGVDWAAVGPHLISTMQQADPVEFALNAYCAAIQLASDAYAAAAQCCKSSGCGSPVCQAGGQFLAPAPTGLSC